MSLGCNQKEEQRKGLLLQNNETGALLDYLCNISADLQKQNNAVHRVISHIAIRSNKTALVEENGITVCNQFNVTREDLIELIRETPLIVKSGVYPHVDETLIRYDGFTHTLDSEIIPTHATETRFLLQTNNDEVLCVTATNDTDIEDGYITPVDNEQISSEEAVEKITPVTGVYTANDVDSIPKNFVGMSKEYQHRDYQHAD